MTAAIILIAAGAAFATNIAKSADDDPVPGYLFDEVLVSCDDKRSDCSTTGSDLCTWLDNNRNPHTLYLLMNGTCSDIELYEPN